ncbi:MAG: Na+/H+ antiporter NhaC, partial [Pseudomonadota bacterium]
MTKQAALPSLSLALTPILLTLAVLGIQLFYFGDFTPHIPLCFGVAFTTFVALKQGLTWNDVEKSINHVIHIALPSILVLINVGMIVGVWIASGTVPTLIYFGLKILSPEIFLAASMLLCSVVSVSLGTSWGTLGTVGLALMGIGAGFEIPAYWTAGAVVSGAFFGDKISPLSDTTNLAPAVTETNLFDHIRNMMPTTVPSMLIAFVIYLVVGFFMIGSGEASFDKINLITTTLEQHFFISPLLLLPALLVIILAIKKVPPIPALFIGAFVGGITAMLAQGQDLHSIFTFANSGYALTTDVAEINSLLNRGG